ncbi:hypothetical protein MKK55_13010 [Methylobacterium sp. J-059]|uniref:hypothetical protein n=1 Tax=Methylobacterium sp. J-059 TaxID=2836643 RepID=UPI001FB95415|nr:hypothetical protein [Methylobacterium sp. J-059]MCJ2039849.1 hypothetical protein [Methylobacterium sp. J-059]
MALLYSQAATATVAANANAVTVAGMDLSAVLPGMVINLGARDRVTGDGFIIAAVTPTGSSGGTLSTVGPIPSAFTNAPFVIDTRDFNGTAPNYLIAIYTQVLATLLRLTSPLTNLLFGSRVLALDKDAPGAISRLLYAIGGRTWLGAEQRTLSYTPTGGALTSVETFGLRAYPDGTLPVDALTIDLTTGGVDVLAASATMVSAAMVDLASAPAAKVAITGGGQITSFGVGKHKVREVHFVDGGNVLVHNATSLILPTGASITTRAGDMLRAMSDALGNWRVRSYQRADGTPLALASTVAMLDPATGKLATAQVPDALLGGLLYHGGWNAATNSPAMPAPASANKGWYFIVTTAGTTSLPGTFGPITDWQIGDWAVSDGTYWEKVDSSDQVISVAGLQGAITAAQLRSALSLVAGQDVQAWDADLDAIAALATTAFGRSLLTQANAASARSALGGVYPTTGFAAEGAASDFTNNGVWTNVLAVDFVATATKMFGYAVVDFTNGSGVATDVQAQLVFVNMTAGGTTVATGRKTIISLPAVAYTGSGNLNPQVQINNLNVGSTYRVQLQLLRVQANGPISQPNIQVGGMNF